MYSSDSPLNIHPDPAETGPSRLGWSSHWDAVRAASPADGVPARVARVDRGHCLVDTGDRQVHAITPTGEQPVTGDWVLLGADDVITELLPRRTGFSRGAGRADVRGQVLAANVDVVGVVQALSHAPNLGRIERFLALAWSSGAQPVVVLSKADLANDPETERAETAAACPGADVICLSTLPGHPARTGLDALRALLPAGSTGVLVGPSGVGKSSLINALAGAEVLTTREIRADGKGRHTSASRELVQLPRGGLLIDTPGLRGVQLWDAEEGLESTFGDIVALAEQCRFNDCEHRTEPGCAIQAAIEAGELSPRRMASYEKLLREQQWLAMRYDARLRAEQRAKWKLRAREVKLRSRP